MAEKLDSKLGHRARLRERFLGAGGEHIPDYELLELLLFAARPRGDVKPLAKTLLKEFKSLSGVIYAEKTELERVEGAGEAVEAMLKAVRVSAQRLLKEESSARPVIQSWTALLDYCRLQMGKEKIEQFRILFLNHKNIMIGDEVLQKGTINHTPVYPREVVKRALEVGAASIILVHNHPSGDATPSEADISMTHAIMDAASGVNIAVHDHLIIAGDTHYSFKSHGLMD